MNSKSAKFACAFCRRKKLKCSRELPKCSNCKPWPGSCEYQRDEPAAATPFPSRVHENTIETRLNRLEQTVHSLANSFDRPAEARDISRTCENAETGCQNSGPELSGKTSDNPRLYIGSSNSFSFLRDASANIDAIAQPFGDATRQSARSELQYLSSKLNTAEIETQSLRNCGDFHVPPKAAGYRLISRFLEYGELGEPFFSFPSDEVIRQVVFEPHKVRETAWIVYFNYMMLSIASDENGEGEETNKFRHNVQLALNDSRIFLEPRHANVQALCFLAMHGEDYAAPNLSWMLLGHACRQAEALGLHSPSQRDTESGQKRLCLFWLLFMIDKSCSLAFGRPAFLPMTLYRNVPLPQRSFLLRWNPHERAKFANYQDSAHGSQFGAEILTRSLEWAKIGGSLVELLATGESGTTKQDIRAKLETWFLDTNQALTQILALESPSANASQVREMSLGISNLKFQYLHALILLLKGDKSCYDLRLSLSRNAISILGSIVSNWSSVYNGVVWQLLYCPFTPFFVIFGHIVRGNASSPAELKDDLALLSATVSYFEEMRSQMRLLANVCSRLQHTASVFLQLAQNHVSRPVKKPGRRKAKLTGNPPRHYSGLVDLDIPEIDVVSYLEWLPAEPEIAISTQDIESHQPDSFGANQGRISGNMFDWFSWDSYYAGADT